MSLLKARFMDILMMKPLKALGLCVCVRVGLLCGDPLPSRDGCPGSEGPSRPFMGPESHLPAGFCPQRPRPDAGQVSHCDQTQQHVWH